MKKVLFSLAIVAAGLLMVSCGGKKIAAEKLTYDDYNWFSWSASVPKDKGYSFAESRPESLAELTDSKLGYLIGDKVVVELIDFDSRSLDEWRPIITDSWPEKVVSGMKDVKVAGNDAIRIPYMIGGSTLVLYGYSYYVAAKGFDSYKSVQINVYPLDGQPDKIADLIEDAEVKYVLSNMCFAPKDE